jgi:hypothetical protein
MPWQKEKSKRRENNITSTPFSKTKENNKTFLDVSINPA